MPEKRRYQVFVSSTFFDLKEERAAVVSALLRSGAFPAGMELFPASDDNAWTLIRRVIDASDYYLLVIGGRYGAVDPETELSYTEMEYDYAVEMKKPVMAFLHGNPDEIPLGKSEKDDAARAKLQAFRAKVQSQKHVNFWTGSKELEAYVALTFSDFPEIYPAVGWVRGDVETSAEALSELNDLRKKVADLEKQLEASRHEPPSGTERFSRGADVTIFRPTYQVRATLTGDNSDILKIHDTETFAGSIANAALTWDDLLSAIGPSMLDEATEWTLSRAIQDWLTRRFRTQAEADVARYVSKEGRELRQFTSVSVDLTAEDFGTLIIQLRALGLIAKSARTRSVKDTATYWALTPYGDEHLTSLRAVRRDGSGGAAETAAAVQASAKAGPGVARIAP